MIKVGCCGYPISMKKYYRKFQLVEINRTFYEHPKMSTVVRWREKAPSDFEFTVKAHQNISHKFRFELEPSIKAFDQMKEICETLKTRILLIQTPASVRPDKLIDAEEFFKKKSVVKGWLWFGRPVDLLGKRLVYGKNWRKLCKS